MTNNQYPSGHGARVLLLLAFGVSILFVALFVLYPTECQSVFRRGGYFVEETFPDPQEHEQ
jgi:hypothetical protein